MDKLEAMLKYVSEHNDFYKKRIAEYGISNPLDITQWPILTRKELQENRYNMFSDGYKSKYFNQQLRRQYSSGSSGIPVNVYWDYKDWYASNMYLWRKRLQWYGVKPSDRYVMFTLNAFGLKNDGKTVYYVNEPANILSVNSSMIQNNICYDKLIYIINEFDPKWFYIQPFLLNELIQAYKQSEIKPPKHLEYIESVGELLTVDLRRRATDFFGVPIANMYGSEEMNGIAYQYPNNQMIIVEENVFVEVEDSNGINTCGNGEAIITNLNNHAMPLIRYNQKDIITSIINEMDNTHIIKNIDGRKLDCISLDNGENLTAMMLLEVIAETNNEFNDAIIEYMYEYNKHEKKLTCIIRLDSNAQKWRKSLITSMINKYHSKGHCLPLLNIVVTENNSEDLIEHIKKNRFLKIVE